MAPRQGWKPKGKPTGRKNPPSGTDADINLATLLPILNDETKAREFLEQKRWPNGPVCSHCGSTEAYRLTAKEGSKSPVRPGVCKCKKCRKQFTIRTGSIFEDSKLPLHKWLMAIHLMCAGKAGISSHELARLLDITQKSAWFVEHRIREAMKMEPLAGMLSGTIETDETYIGARFRRYPRRGKKRGPTGDSKAPVLALVERGGKAVAFPIERSTAKTLKGSIRTLADSSSTIMTDQSKCYANIGDDFGGRHHTVNHSKDEYVRYEQCGEVIVSTNTVESFFARIKRSFIGVHHQMSRRHLHRYVTEAEFKWNSRDVSDGARMVQAIKGAGGRRLMYRDPK
ncbi:MAG: IS1595 family transposase [Planctomycetaceae bacterium]|nr:IS1595 family transposase [Planctomycetaceae bacterium]